MVEWREGRATLWIMIVRDETTLHRSAASGRSTRDDRLTGCVGQELLAVHRSYLKALTPVLHHPALHALAHITGGGLTDNLPRVLPKDTRAEIRVGAWEIPEIFHFLESEGEVPADEMFRVFNMGVGMVAVVEKDGLRDVLAALRKVGEKPFLIGSVQRGGSGVVYNLGAQAADSADLEAAT